MSPNMLRITIEEDEAAAVLKLEGRVAGPWVAELSRYWREKAPLLESRKLLVDLSNVTYSDAVGTRVLGAIYAQTAAELITGTPWTQYLAEEVRRNSAQPIEEEL
jgi:anti-anti-sigma regulatory factor